MRILVTGGAGFIGSHIVAEYLKAGHDVAVVDNLWAHGGGKRENVPEEARFYQMDIRDPELREVLLKERPEVVNHHAAQHSVKLSTDEPAFDAQINVLGLINVLTAAQEAGVRKVIFASSAATYGTVEQLPITEQTPQRPESPYGITKMVSEHYLRYWHQERGPLIHGAALLQCVRTTTGSQWRGRRGSDLCASFPGPEAGEDLLGRRTDQRLCLRA